MEIDGSMHSGSGTLLRYAVALATMRGEPLHMVRIRSKRDQPGLRPQHLRAVQACNDLSGGILEGAKVGSREIYYRPGSSLKSGDFHWDIGTAGSTTMLAFTLIPIALAAHAPCRFSLAGGLFQDFAPSAFHMQEVLLPLLRRMGAEVQLEILRPGYVPQGKGHLMLEVRPLEAPLNPLTLKEQGRVREVRGTSLASHLAEERVAERMAERCAALLQEHGHQPRMTVIQDTRAVQKGAALLLVAETETGCLLGADQAGKRGRRSEAIAEFVARSLLEDLETEATVDRHLADQLILFAALAQGTTEYRVPQITDHVNSNRWLVEKILGAGSELQGNFLRLEGIGFRRGTMARTPEG